MKISQIVAVTSWCSVVLILWGMVTKVFESSFVTWFAFMFFLMAFLVSASLLRNTQQYKQ